MIDYVMQQDAVQPTLQPQKSSYGLLANSVGQNSRVREIFVQLYHNSNLSISTDELEVALGKSLFNEIEVLRKNFGTIID